MNIGIMLRHFGQPGGINVYTTNIVRSLLDTDHRNTYWLMYGQQKDTGTYAAFPNAREIGLPVHSRLWWDQVTVPQFVRRKQIDVVFNPKLSIPLYAGCKTVWVMHGAAQFAVPNAYLWHDRLYFSVANRIYAKRADAIITPTQTGARDIAHFMGADPAKIHVTPYAPNIQCRIIDKSAAEEVRTRLKLPTQFILFVGGISPLKNFGNILRAYASIHQQFPHKLVAAGFRRWKYSADLSLLDQLDIRDDVIFTDFVTDEDLVAIYNLADLFVFPSLYEGFGIPALEAMACGCPVVTTNTGCTPEVVDDAALLVNPYDAAEIAWGIQTLLSDDAYREQLMQKGLQRVQSFSWELCAQKTLNVFESLVSSHAGAS
jgi:glycosyltransferase involved in cell wall biosynthesis